LDLTDVRHIAEEDYSAWTKRVTPQPGDIVFTYEATLNRYAIIPEGFRGCLGRRTALIRPNPDAVNSRFLFFYFFSEDWRKTIGSNILSGATVDRIPLTRFPTFPITLPERAVQDRIAAILSAYDDLIENNTRRIKILEEMAQMSYREWFVNFRFPGHQKVKMMESELGPIPAGWEVARLENVVDEFIDYRGKTPKKLDGDWAESGIFALSALNVKQGRLVNLEKAKFVNEELYQRWMKSELRAGDVLMTSEAPLGEVYFMPETRRYCLSQRVFAIRSKCEKMQSSLLFFFLSSPEGQEQLKARASGTTVLGIRQADLRRIPLIQAPVGIQRQGDSVLRPILHLIDTIQRKNHNLRTTRDLLLPKLISGEVSVEAAAEAMEQTA
jgi:type I restriction enzyme S subunit